MLIWGLLSLLKGQATSTQKSRNNKKVSFERRSVRAYSISSVSRKRQLTWVEPAFSPNEQVFECILQYLDLEDSLKLLRVCQVWSTVVAEIIYQTPPILYEDSFSKLTSLLLSNNPSHPYPLLVKEFVFNSISANELLMGDLQDCLKVCPNLASFRLEGCTSMSKLLIQFLGEHCPFISRIEFPSCMIDDSFLVQLIRTITSLRYIDVSNTNVSLSSLPLIVRECSNLETLNMTGCKGSPPEMVIDYEASEYYLVGDTLKKYRNLNLKQVSLGFTEVTDSMIGYVCRHCDSLEQLYLNGCRLITDNAINSVAMHCPNISQLDLSFCKEITDISLQSLAVHLSIQTQKVSTKSKRYSNTYTSFQEYIPKPSRPRNFRKINLTGCNLITPSSLILLAKKCPSLDSIVVDGCPNILSWYNSTSDFETDSESSYQSAKSRNSMDSIESHFSNDSELYYVEYPQHLKLTLSSSSINIRAI